MFKIELDYTTSSRNEPRYVVERRNEFIDRVLWENHDAYFICDLPLRQPGYDP